MLGFNRWKIIDPYKMGSNISYKWVEITPINGFINHWCYFTLLLRAPCRSISNWFLGAPCSINMSIKSYCWWKKSCWDVFHLDHTNPSAWAIKVAWIWNIYINHDTHRTVIEICFPIYKSNQTIGKILNNVVKLNAILYTPMYIQCG